MNAVPPYDIIQAVRAELAVPGRYHLAAPPSQPSLLAQVWSWIVERWTQFWNVVVHRLSLTPGAAHAIGDAMVIVFGAVVVLGVVQILLRMELEAAARGGAVPLEMPRSAQSYAIAAAQAASSGDYTRAVRLLFIAAVTLLELRGVVRDERSATINELRRELRSRDAALEAPFLDLARAYTSAAYAEQPLDANAWEHARLAYTRLREHATT